MLPDLALEPVGVLADAPGGLLELAGVELDAGLLGLAQHAHERQLDLGQQVAQPALGDLLALALGELGDQPGALRLQVLGEDGDPPLLGELVERVAAARRVEQEAGDLGVERELGRDLAERLGVVGQHRAVAGGDDELGRVVDRADDRGAAGRERGEAPAGLGRQQLALGDVGRGGDEHELVPAQGGDVGGLARAGLDRQRLRGLGPRDLRHLELGQRLLEAPQRVAQLPLAEHGPHAGAVDLARHLGLEVDVDRDVAHHRRELLGQPRRVGVLGQVLLALGARDLVDAGQHRLEVAEALQQVRRRLVADPRDARDVVGGVALEPDEVGDQLRRDPVAVDHALAVVDLRVGDAAAGGHDPHAVADELVGVAVAGHDHHGDPALLRLLGQRGDHVVGLVALDGDVAVPERLHERAQVRPLELEQVGPRGALGLVVGRDLLAAGHARVPDDDRRHGAVVGQDLHEHRREAEQRVGRPPVGGRDRFRQREEGAIGERVAVDQEQLAGVVSVGRHLHPEASARGARGRRYLAAMLAVRAAAPALRPAPPRCARTRRPGIRLATRPK